MISLLAVKPQQLKEVCQALASRLNGGMVLSIAAGIRCDAMTRWLGSERIVRVMPNTPAMVGKAYPACMPAAESVPQTVPMPKPSCRLPVLRYGWTRKKASTTLPAFPAVARPMCSTLSKA
jgi:hypothetical protein